MQQQDYSWKADRTLEMQDLLNARIKEIYIGYEKIKEGVLIDFLKTQDIYTPEQLKPQVNRGTWILATTGEELFQWDGKIVFGIRKKITNGQVLVEISKLWLCSKKTISQQLS